MENFPEDKSEKLKIKDRGGAFHEVTGQEQPPKLEFCLHCVAVLSHGEC